MVLHTWAKPDLIFPSHTPGQAAQLNAHMHRDLALNVLFIQYTLANLTENTPQFCPALNGAEGPLPGWRKWLRLQQGALKETEEERLEDVPS